MVYTTKYYEGYIRFKGYLDERRYIWDVYIYQMINEKIKEMRKIMTKEFFSPQFYKFKYGKDNKDDTDDFQKNTTYVKCI